MEGSILCRRHVPVIGVKDMLYGQGWIKALPFFSLQCLLTTAQEVTKIALKWSSQFKDPLGTLWLESLLHHI